MTTESEATPEMEGGQGASWPPKSSVENAPAPAAPAKPAPAAPLKPAPAEGEKPPEEEPATAATEPYALKIPEYVTGSERTDERERFVSDFAALAPEAGITPGQAQDLIDAVADFAVTLPYSVELAYSTPDEARTEMERVYGAEPAKHLIDRCVAFTQTLPDSVQNWLDETGLGNDVAVITALAFAQSGWFDRSLMTPAIAQTELDKLMHSPDYTSSDPQKRLFTVAKVQILSRIVHGTDSPEQQLNRVADRKASGHDDWRGGAEPAVDASAARKEIAAMLSDRNGPLMNRGNRDHEAAVLKYHSLVAKL